MFVELVVYPFYSVSSRITVEGKKLVNITLHVNEARGMEKYLVLESNTENFAVCQVALGCGIHT